MAETLRVTYHHEPSSWWAESDDLPGFSAAGETLREVRELVREGIAFALGDADIELLESHSQGNPVIVYDVHTPYLGAETIPQARVELHIDHITVGVGESAGPDSSHDPSRSPNFRLSGLAAV